MTFILKVKNGGTKATTGSIVVTDTIEPIFDFGSISGTDWDCLATVPPDISCTYTGNGGSLDPGASAPDLILVVTLLPPGAFIIQNTAVVTTMDDSDPDNDSSTFIFNEAVRTAPVLSILGLVALILLLSGVAFAGLKRLRAGSKS